ncbi:T9SS type A sorting domain-containing protein [bacterium]|nr:T9SS type A sorting domain-containing protein [bacterium]
MHRRFHLALAAAVALIGQSASATTINVPADQSTIQLGVTAASPGDTVLVANGIYAENVTVNKNVTLLSVNGRAMTTILGQSSAGSLGTLWITSNTTALQIGGVGQGFTILGIDNGAPGVENAAVYFQGPHSNAQILDNEIVANGDHGLLTEYGAVISGFVIDGNEFSGQTFVGANPAGLGFGDQFTLPNVPRQLCVMGGGTGGGNTSNTTFINNVVSGTAGGTNTLAQEQGNTLATIDSNGATITGNTFAGTTTRYATSLRARGPSTTISGNNFDSTGIQAPLGATAHVYHKLTGETSQDIALNNTYDKGVYIAGLTESNIGWKIQPFIDASPGGTTIDALPGTYTEQLAIDGKDLTVRGSGAGSTTIASPASLATTFTTSGPNKPIVTATNSGNIVVRDLTVDGLGLGNANNRFEGVAFWNAGGAVLDCDVVNIIETPWSGVQHGVGIYAFNDTGGPYSIEVGGCNVTSFQKTGIALNGDGVMADVHDCTTVGGGATSITAQNGIQFYGPSGSITDCVVSDVRYVPTSYVASGLLLYAAGNVDVSGVTLVDAEEAIYFDVTGGSIDNVNITYPTISIDYDGIFPANYGVARGTGSRATASPSGDAAVHGRAAMAATSVTITNSCLTGPTPAAGVGVYAYSAGAPISVDASGLTITGFDYGCVADGGACSFDINSSSISGNASAGYDNTLSGTAQDATLNWWGAADGPSGDGAGAGDAVASVGGEASFDPYLVDGTSSTSCVFTPTENTVTPNPSIPCISTVNPCVPVSFDIARSDNVNMRGYSVTFTLSPELELCSGLSSIAEGTYLDSATAAPTVFLALDNGGGSYTVDCSILGIPCGATAANGDLFGIEVQAAGGDGTGTITITEVIMRGCVNDPLPAAAGAPAMLDLDATPPVPVAGLAATQVTSGNDADGTTGITLNFTVPGDAAVTEVYRKGFGAYPEYDDSTGVAPTIPADPTDALSNGWTLTGVTTGGGVDETTVRDYYYFVLFTEDACGNVSPPSNMAGGTLNYHLGDVSDGSTPGQGDNLVAGVDLSLLGSNYGLSIAYLDPLNYLDVGPTSTNFVDGLPLTDNEVEFEDLMMFAINYGVVGRIPGTPGEMPVENPQLALVVDSTPAAGGTMAARLVLSDNVRSVKGIHSDVSFDASRLELVSVAQGSLLADQAASVFFKDLPSDGAVVVDAAVMGRDLTVQGSGDVAVLTFRVIASGAAPVLEDAALRGRDNRRAGRPVTPVLVETPASQPAAVSVPERLELLAARPNPFSKSTDIVFRLPATSPVSVKIYDVTGRHVRTLVDRTMTPGEHRTAWDGRGSDGRPVGSGIYFYTFRSEGLSRTHRLVHTR